MGMILSKDGQSELMIDVKNKVLFARPLSKEEKGNIILASAHSDEKKIELLTNLGFSLEECLSLAFAYGDAEDKANG